MIRRACVECGRLAVAGRNRCVRHLSAFEVADARRRNAKTVRHGVKRKHFQTLRAQRLWFSGGLCELRVDRACTLHATTVHLDPALGGDHDRATINDVRAACRHCHGVLDGRRSHG